MKTVEEVKAFLNTHKLILYRKLIGISQSGMAKVIGMNRSKYNNIECGRSRLTSKEKQIVLTHFYAWRDKHIQELNDYINYLKAL